ncbi:hypothetical protein IID24_03815 [Patescibacteria group bacterium]|nr:hypothetical protein [Patescibacteria group bacterium]
MGREAELPQEIPSQTSAIQQDESADLGDEPDSEEGSIIGEKIEDTQFTLVYGDFGYSPAELTVGIGDTVMFRNESSRTFWPASDIHPTHAIYPGSGIQKCGTSTAEDIFDACEALEPGETWTFTFGDEGFWSYHNHRFSSHKGVIIVK